MKIHASSNFGIQLLLTPFSWVYLWNRKR